MDQDKSIAEYARWHGAPVHQYDSGTTYFLYKEICIPESVPSAYQPSFEYTINECFYLKNGYIIAASTERAEAFAITIEGDDWKYPIS